MPPIIVAITAEGRFMPPEILAKAGLGLPPANVGKKTGDKIQKINKMMGSLSMHYTSHIK